MIQEPFFIVNEFLEVEKKEIQEIINYLDVKDNKSINRAIFLRNFSNFMFNAYRKQKTLIKDIELNKYQEKISLIKRKKELLEKLKNIKEKEI